MGVGVVRGSTVWIHGCKPPSTVRQPRSTGATWDPPSSIPRRPGGFCSSVARVPPVPSDTSRRRLLCWGAAAAAVGAAGCSYRDFDIVDSLTGNSDEDGSSEGTDDAASTPTEAETPSATLTATPPPSASATAPRLIAADGDAGDRFGTSVALDGARALVGAPFDEDPHGDDGGSAYVFERATDGWTQRAKLTPEDGVDEARFGSAVALNGNTTVVGAPFADHANGGDSGAAYVFSRANDDWTQVASLAAADGDEGDVFGTAVAVTGDRALIGAPFDDDPYGDASGSAYLFEKTADGWAQVTKLIADEGGSGDLFGGSVALADGMALIGAYWVDDPNGSRSGATYVFERSGDDWRQNARLVAGDGAEGDEFGWDVALADETALVGAPRHQQSDAREAGAVYAFSPGNEGWRQETKIVADDAGNLDRFGWALSLADGRAVVGAPWADAYDGVERGTAYVFERDGSDWHQESILAVQDGAEGDKFGESVSLVGGMALVGAPRSDEPNGDAAGSASVFDL